MKKRRNIIRYDQMFNPCLLLLFVGCRKGTDSSKCYECEMTYESGIAAGKQYPCSTNIAQWQKEQKDNRGYPIKSSCKEL